MEGFAAAGKSRALTLDEPPETPTEVEHSTTFAVRRSDLDRVGHANNVRFVEWMLEGLPDDAGLREVEVLYRSEAVYGDEVVSEASPLIEDQRFHQLRRASDGRTLALTRTLWTPCSAPS